ncbi:MAG: hypothetical protein MUW56_18140 [Chryseobacterium sp.]|uniref:hypothetical protein n=1 Tax=Chryseobacterium sp. TaxID=1871047 RepID=UPI0025B81EE6|nr:hypothetical protein [Chryseobacterium sp.]MCJ7935484.1 hypothetical protein [Chryseobacterium sp.]
MNIIKNAKKLRKEDLKNIAGGISGNPDLSLCGCSCSGSVTWAMVLRTVYRLSSGVYLW